MHFQTAMFLIVDLMVMISPAAVFPEKKNTTHLKQRNRERFSLDTRIVWIAADK